MKKAVIYARVSSKDQERTGYSIPAQLQLLRDYAHKRGIDVSSEFLETESAGRSGRREFTAMVKLIERDKDVGIILVEKTDRLYRNFKDQVLLADLDVEIHFVKDGRIIGKNSKSSDRFVHDIETAQSRFFLNNLSDEVKKGQGQKIRHGKYPGGPVPFGYRRNAYTKEIELDSERASIIRSLFEVYCEGDKSITDIRRIAKRMGLTYPKSGRPISRSGIERMLKSVFYCGSFRWNGTAYIGDHPPTVSPELFDKVQRTFAERTNGKTGSRSFTFTRLMTCSECGNTVTAEIKKGRYTYYHCTGFGTKHKIEYVPELVVSEQFSQVVSSVALPTDFYEYLKTCLKSEKDQAFVTLEAERKQLELSRDKTLADMKKALQKNLDGHIGDDLLGEMQRELQTRLSAIKYRLSNLSTVIPSEYDRAAEIIELSHKAESRYVSANPTQKRKLIKSLLSNCALDGRTLCPTYKKPFDLFAKGIKSGKWRRDRDSPPSDYATS